MKRNAMRLSTMRVPCYSSYKALILDIKLTDSRFEILASLEALLDLEQMLDEETFAAALKQHGQSA